MRDVGGMCSLGGRQCAGKQRSTGKKLGDSAHQILLSCCAMGMQLRYADLPCGPVEFVESTKFLPQARVQPSVAPPPFPMCRIPLPKNRNNRQVKVSALA
jgi:hypothetical protein